MIGISCRQAAALLSRSHHETLGAVRRLSLAVHLAICGNCRNYSRQLDWLDRALTGSFDDPSLALDASARARIAATLPAGGDDAPSGPDAS